MLLRQGKIETHSGKTECKKSTEKKKDADQDDGVFRSIFNRNPQNFDKSSMLSAKERELIRNYDVSKDPAAGQIHKDGRKSDTRNKDWVFGTENGSYF